MMIAIARSCHFCSTYNFLLPIFMYTDIECFVETKKLSNKVQPQRMS